MTTSPAAVSPDPAGATAASATPTPDHAASGTWLALVAAIAVAALLLSGLLWQRLGHLQEQLARQTAEAQAQATQAHSVAREAQDIARETAARQSVSDTRLSEVALQRSQLEELMQSLSRSRDENLVVDIEAALRLAQQQAQLTGSVEPLLSALQAAEQRIARAAQPRLAPLQRALERDIDRLKSAAVTDTPALLARLDELARLSDDLPTLYAVGPQFSGHNNPSTAAPTRTAAPTNWWLAQLRQAFDVVRDEARNLVRVSRIDQPEAALLAPEQSFFLRENLKLKLLNARLGVLARQTEAARADLAGATLVLNKYFDPSARKTQHAAGLLQQVTQQLRAVEIPRIDDTLAALSTAAAGR